MRRGSGPRSPPAPRVRTPRRESRLHQDRIALPLLLIIWHLFKRTSCFHILTHSRHRLDHHLAKMTTRSFKQKAQDWIGCEFGDAVDGAHDLPVLTYCALSSPPPSLHLLRLASPPRRRPRGRRRGLQRAHRRVCSGGDSSGRTSLDKGSKSWIARLTCIIASQTLHYLDRCERFLRCGYPQRCLRLELTATHPLLLSRTGSSRLQSGFCPTTFNGPLET